MKSTVPNTYRGRTMTHYPYKFILGCFLFILPPIGSSSAFEDGDRPGGDYTSFSIPRNQPTTLCATACQRDPRCVAWTLDFRGSIETPMRCWLKNSAPPLQPLQQLFSGLKRPLEPNIDRLGSDFDSFDLDFPDPLACQVRCDVNDGCRAWTYVNPGVQGANARCWLKGSLPSGQSNNCCISGHK
jgi:hypothetical protein